MTRLRLNSVACRRGGHMLFSHFTLSLQPGSSALIEGPNGVGKSSLLRLAAGLLLPFEGSIEREGRLALSDEALALDTERDLIDALSFWVDRDAAFTALDALNIAHLAHVPVRMLSTGQRKRATLARVAASSADIWLLDEPANGLDTRAVAALGTLMQAHVAAGGVLLAASHQSLPLTFDQTVTLERPT